MKNEDEVNKLLKMVCEVTGAKLYEVVSNSRKQKCVFARFMFVHFAERRLKMKAEEIMPYIGRDRTNYYHCRTTHNIMVDHHTEYRVLFDKAKELEGELYGLRNINKAMLVGIDEFDGASEKQYYDKCILNVNNSFVLN